MLYIPKRIETRDNRDSLININSDVNLIYQNKTVTSLLDSIPVITLILNKFRQILFCNKAYHILTSTEPQRIVLGLRPGELFGCAYHQESIDGCGESEHCLYCQVVCAIREAQNSHKQVSTESRLTLLQNNVEVSVDFNVTATPFEFSGSDFLTIIFEDISSKKRKNVLERIFFHDIIDKISSLDYSLENSIRNIGTEKGNESVFLAKRLSHELVSEILGQRILLHAENNDLQLTITVANIDEIIQNAVNQIKNHQVSTGKSINYLIKENFSVVTDYLVLNRILINMMKNALEASSKGESITISCSKDENDAIFSVKNNSEMSQTEKAQVFQRSFSTKGKNRGIGTYSMKLLGEKFLKGKVWFDSTIETGTVFYLKIPLKIENIVWHN